MSAKAQRKLTREERAQIREIMARAHKHGNLRNKDYRRPDVAPAPGSGTTSSPATPPNSPSR